MGIGGVQGSVNGALIPELFGPYWIQDDHVVCIHNSDVGIWLYKPSTGDRALLDSRAANELAADGNVWAAWLAGFGLYSSTGIHFPSAGLMDVGPNGAIGYIPDRATDNGVEVIEVNGEIWNLTLQPVAELNLVGNHQAVWRDFNFNFNTHDLPPITTIPGMKWHPHAILVDGDWWISYLSLMAGLVLHPFNSTVGYRLVPYSDFIFHPDSVALNSNLVKTVWSKTQGEGPNDYIESVINTVLDPRIELVGSDPIVAIGKDCWLTWFEFNQPPPQDPPGNAIVKIRYDISGSIVRLDGSRFANWVDGVSVAEIEQKIAGSFYPCVAYWDGRNWPEWPTIRTYDWLALQAYCFNSESPALFESNMRAVIHDAQQRYNKIALVCQCYTSNASLTTDLKGLVPVYARLARDYPSINHLLVFSDQDRATGLNSHPELRPYWEELYAGITGEPGGNVDPEILPENVFNTLEAVRPKYPTPLVDGGARLLNEVAWIHRNEGWGLERKDSGNNCPQTDTGVRCGCDILRLQNSGYDCLLNSENEAVPTRGARGDADPSRFVPPVDPGVEPSDFRVDIIEYDTLVHRSDPKGMLIRFDVTSSNPVVKIDLDLVNDGEPSIPVIFLDEPRRDGRYCRALAFKPTVNGDWTLRVTATDNQGNTATRDGVWIVHVEP